MIETGEKVSSPSSSVRKDLEFFKVFLPEYSSHELVIPPAFITILKNPLPNDVLLLDEIGRLWCVKTETEERDGVVFKKGWEIFANDQSLEFGDFLVFSYNGDSIFTVTIFAKYGCKKDLAVVKTTDRSRASVQKEPVSFVKPKPEESCGFKRNLKRETVKEEPSVLVDIKPEFFSTFKTEPDHPRNTRRKVNRVGDTCDVSWVPETKHEELQESIEKPKNPHFVRNITNGSLNKLEIPTTFLKSNGIELEQDIELCDENGKKWPMKIVNHDRGLKFAYETWLSFCKSHKLKTTNKCLFEFNVRSDGRCNEIQVRVFRGTLLTTNTKSNYQVLAM